ncbi:hypothetical protein WICMUC_001453 [Wickerhamomyces mucosus]|uniref:Uncharacterized protein n=1 Tax=Wickerhamomyces mucosus TaxID=1378264 RepID=A0A9P8TGX3_9ASCO|nr:hypothetical protein WICMUC_001453 [Wickerhamomyces mucosus]
MMIDFSFQFWFHPTILEDLFLEESPNSLLYEEVRFFEWSFWIGVMPFLIPEIPYIESISTACTLLINSWSEDVIASLEIKSTDFCVFLSLFDTCETDADTESYVIGNF